MSASTIYGPQLTLKLLSRPDKVLAWLEPSPELGGSRKFQVRSKFGFTFIIIMKMYIVQKYTEKNEKYKPNVIRKRCYLEASYVSYDS